MWSQTESILQETFLRENFSAVFFSFFLAVLRVEFDFYSDCVSGSEGLHRDVSVPLVRKGCGLLHPMARCNFTESDNMKNMDWVQREPSHVLDRHEQILWFFCCWFSQVIVSTPQAVDRGLTDRRRRRACHCWQPKARSLWEAHGEWVSIGMETQVYFISLPKCKGESAWEPQRKRDRERRRERPGPLKASVVSSGDGQPKHLRAVWMAF